MSKLSNYRKFNISLICVRMHLLNTTFFFFSSLRKTETPQISPSDANRLDEGREDA